MKVNWHEDESVYYALFGENVTESLKNCIVYDSELEPIYIAGKFGVYSAGAYFEDEDHRYVGAEAFYIGDIPQTVSEPVKDGFPFMRGALSLKQEFDFDSNQILLQIEGDYQMAEVKVNDQVAGKLLFEQELDVSEHAKQGKNDVEVRFVLGNYNLLGPQHFVGNRNGNVSPVSFELNGHWDGPISKHFHEWYDLRKLYVNS